MDAGFEAERKYFGELAMTPESKGLFSLFRGQTECKKNRFGKPNKPINTVRIFNYFIFFIFKLLFCYHKNYFSITIRLLFWVPV